MLKPATLRSGLTALCRGSGRCTVRCVAALLLALSGLPSYGQPPGLGLNFKAAPTPPSNAAEVEPQDDSSEKVRALLKAAQAELDRVVAAPAEALQAPAGTPPDQLLVRQALLRQMVRSFEQQLDEIAALKRLNNLRDTMHERLEHWRVDESRATFSMLEVEALRASAQSTLRRVDMLTINLKAIDSQTEFAFETSKRLDEYARQLLEKIEKRSGETQQLLWERALILQRNQVAAVSVDALKTRRQLREEELSQARLELDFLQNQLHKTQGKLQFSESDRNALTGELDRRLKALDRELEKALTETRIARESLSDAEANLSRASTPQAAGADAGRHVTRQEPLMGEAELARMRLDTANSRAGVARLLMASIDLQRSVWSTWYDIVHTGDSNSERLLAASIRSLRDTVIKMHAGAEATYQYTLQQLTELERAIIEAPESGDAGLLGMKAATLRERTQYGAHLVGELVSTKDLLDRWNASFVADAGRVSTDLNLDEWQRRVAYYASAIWSFELFAAEDTIEVDGRKLSTTRSITLGKVVTAILILVIGMLLGRLLIHAACRFSVRYLKTAENETMLAGKWFFALLFVILFALSLATVKIPFTVFAFLGGAVAIGIGFGMQTLFKNLISGLMILFERPFRLGDMVEVGNIRGKVVDINLRSSLIRNRDDIETLVPNSTFIEQEVTNWTYSSRRVRFSLNVGVAYGSPTKEVRELLLATAKRHRLILEDPAPEVFFEDFGSDALAFSLQYWLDITAGVDLRRVASDLRFMLDKAFADAGIVLAFPQRDVHLDVGQPIPIRIMQTEQKSDSE